MGIRRSLMEDARCEGEKAALEVAEGWHRALEDMAEQASQSERELILPLIQEVNLAIKRLSIWMPDVSRVNGLIRLSNGQLRLAEFASR